MMEVCTVLQARRYEFKDDDGRLIEGVTLIYLTGDVEKTGNRRGCAPLTVSAPVEIFADLGPLPGIYGMDFKQRPGKGGRPSLQVVGLHFQTPLDGHLRPVSAP
jgi:hypothetical protein